MDHMINIMSRVGATEIPSRGNMKADSRETRRHLHHQRIRAMNKTYQPRPEKAPVGVEFGDGEII